MKSIYKHDARMFGLYIIVPGKGNHKKHPTQHIHPTQFGKEPHMGTMARCPHTFANVV